MTTRDRDLSRETDVFGDLTAHARAALSDDIAAELRDIAPDFAAVVEAAHARDPKRVPFAALVEAQDLAPVVALGDSSPRIPGRQHAELAAILADARAEIDAEAAAACPGPTPVPATRWPRRLLWGLAAAAAVLLAVSAQSILATRQAPSHDGANQAPLMERAADSAREAELLSPPPPAREPRNGATPLPEPAPLLQPEPVPEPAPEPALELPAAPAEPVQKASKLRPARETLADRLRRLDAEAEQAWQSGDFAGAERRYREILALAPGSRAADLSYGDLFTLSRQRSGPDEEQALWREYLAVFPRGRYADDARAGLCRRAAADARAGCWQQYLADFPDGVHRTQATRALAAP